MANFYGEMQLFGWKGSFYKYDNKLSINDLIGSGTPFNNVSVGVLLLHGNYGTTQDYQASLCKQMYYAVTSGGSLNYLRMSQMNLGGSDPTNGLKWFMLDCCDSLYHANWNSMISAGQKPYNSNLHLLLGADSPITTSQKVLKYWAQYINFGVTNMSPLTVHDAYYLAGRNALQGKHYNESQVYAIAGDSACFNDYVQQGYNSAPQGTWTYESQQVWP